MRPQLFYRGLASMLRAGVLIPAAADELARNGTIPLALANEIGLLAARLDVDAGRAIDLANRHPRVNILMPGAGVGGHCIAVDPWFIVSSATPTMISSDVPPKLNGMLG